MFLIISVLSSTEMILSIGEKLLPFEKCPYSELCWSVFSHIPTGYGDLLYKSPYSVQISKKSQKTDTFFKQWSSVDKAVEYH